MATYLKFLTRSPKLLILYVHKKLLLFCIFYKDFYLIVVFLELLEKVERE